MTQRPQRLSTSGSFSVGANAVLNVPTGIQDQFGNALTPHFIEFITACPFLMILQKNANGSFDVFNPTAVAVTATWKAHHMHSIEMEPVYATSIATAPSVVVPPTPTCSWPVLPANDAILQKYAVRQGGAIPNVTIMDVDYNTASILYDPNGAFTYAAGALLFNRAGYYQLNASLHFHLPPESLDAVSLFAYRKQAAPPLDILTPIYKQTYHIATDLIGEPSHSIEINGPIYISSASLPAEQRTYFVGAQSLLGAALSGIIGPTAVGLPAANYEGMLEVVKLR